MPTLIIRSNIQQLVSSIIPFDHMEQNHLDFVLNWIDSGCELCRLEKPAIPAVHLVSYFVIVTPEKDQILLVDHKKAELWLPPGGHVEPNEHPKDTVKREAKEELGIEANFLLENPLFLTVTETVGQMVRHTDVSLWYVLQAEKSHFFVYDTEEFNQICWFSFNEIPFQQSDPHLKRFIEKLNLQKGEK